MTNQRRSFRPFLSALLILCTVAMPVAGQPTPSPATPAPISIPTDAPVTDDPTDMPTTSPTEVPTTSPTSSPTELPTEIPTLVPTSAPTGSPTSRPTDSPTSLPTESPTNVPTDSPTDGPTGSPTNGPTDSPSQIPTGSPTSAPSPAPSEVPTNKPSMAPTNGPTGAPSLAPTLSPVVTPRPTRQPVITLSPSSIPSDSPTSGPTSQPSSRPSPSPSMAPTTLAPTGSPSGKPTRAPIIGTLQPTLSSEPSGTPTSGPTTTPSGSPTRAPVTITLPTDSPTTSAPVEITDSPTMGPSASPSLPLVMAQVTNLSMELVGVNVEDFDDESEAAFAELTADHAMLYFAMRPDLNVEDFQTAIAITSVTGSSRRAARGLQSSSVMVVYDQDMLYRSSDPSVDVEFLTTDPFADEESRDEYATLLVESDVPGLADVESVSPVVFPTESPSTSPSEAMTDPDPEEDEPSGISTGAIIGIAVAGGATLIGCLLYNFCNTGGGDANLVDPQDAQLDTYIVKQEAVDEISTLGPPQGLTDHVTRLGGGGYENQSVGTIDQIYSDAYAGGGESMVSSAAGTFGSNTHGLTSALDPDSVARGAALGAAPGDGASDSDSFDAQYAPSSNVREEVINVIAPAGKLGVVIDTPDDGAPVVHAVKDSSVIADQVQVGDLLVAVDDEDVRNMTAIKVSRLISRKSANPSRKLTIVRKTLTG